MVCVRWYLRYSLRYRDLRELMCERNLSIDPSTIWRWVQRYAPELNERIRRELKPTNGSWRTDEAYVRVPGRWTYLYRAVDSTGATIDFLLSATRDLTSARRFFQKALPPRRSDMPFQLVCAMPCCLRPTIEGSAFGLIFVEATSGFTLVTAR
jgi:IS6 family transposase